MKTLSSIMLLGAISLFFTLQQSIAANCPRPLRGLPIVHNYYKLSFRLDESIAEWSCHTINTKRLGFKSNRSFPFNEDPLLGDKSPHPTAYKYSGYDRGHLVPAADMSFNEIAAKESFYMSNMTPQVPAFNRNVWSKVEDKMRDLGQQYGEVLVISGPLLNGHLQKLMDTDIVIPQYFFKVGIYKTPNGRTEILSYLIPNAGVEIDENAKKPYPRDWVKILQSFEVPVAQIEKATGIKIVGN